MSAYRRDFDGTKYISFLIKDDEVLEKYNENWENVRHSIKKEFDSFDSKPAYNQKYPRTKINSYKGEINTNFHNKKKPKECSHCICLSLILIDSAYRNNQIYCPEVFLEESKYIVKDKKMSEYITDEIEISSDDADREDSDEENSDEENQI